jgi:hypothetical protein
MADDSQDFASDFYSEAAPDLPEDPADALAAAYAERYEREAEAILANGAEYGAANGAEYSAAYGATNDATLHTRADLLRSMAGMMRAAPTSIRTFEKALDDAVADHHRRWREAFLAGLTRPVRTEAELSHRLAATAAEPESGDWLYASLVLEYPRMSSCPGIKHWLTHSPIDYSRVARNDPIRLAAVYVNEMFMGADSDTDDEGPNDSSPDAVARWAVEKVTVPFPPF